MAFELHSPLVGNRHRLWQPSVAVSIQWSRVSLHFSVNSIAHLCQNEISIRRVQFVVQGSGGCIFILCIYTYLTWADALLFIVKFSANEANELSKSPVSTFPELTADGCGAADAFCTPPIAEPRTFPDWTEPAPDDADEAGPAGFNTSPNASKPFVWLFWICFFFRFCFRVMRTLFFFCVFFNHLVF